MNLPSLFFCQASLSVQRSAIYKSDVLLLFILFFSVIIIHVDRLEETGTWCCSCFREIWHMRGGIWTVLPL